MVKNPPQCRRPEFNPWVGKICQRRKWQTIPVFLPGEFHGQRSLAGYSPWGHKRVKHNLVTKQQCFCFILAAPMASLVAQMVKNLPAMQETWDGGWRGEVLNHKEG